MKTAESQHSLRMDAIVPIQTNNSSGRVAVVAIQEKVVLYPQEKRFNDLERPDNWWSGEQCFVSKASLYAVRHSFLSCP